MSELLGSNDEEILIDACWALSYITDGADQHLSEVIDSGAVERLMPLLLYIIHPSIFLYTNLS